MAAVGANCTAPADIADALAAAGTATDLPLVAYPNHGGRWEGSAQCWIGDGADEPAAHVDEWVALGARLIGGCCGVGSAEIGRLAAARDAPRR